MMENLLIDLDREMATTRRMLERYPSGKGEWLPHDKSRSLSALATHIASIPDHGARILTTLEMDVATRQPQPPKDSAAELLETFDAGVTRLKAAVARDKAAGGAAAQGAQDDDSEEPRVSLANRAFPLIELLEAAAKRKSDVMWDR